MSDRIFMETTKISPGKTIGEVQGVLAEYGANNILIEYDNTEVSALSFVYKVEGKAIAYRLPSNWQVIYEKLTDLKYVFTNEEKRELAEKMAHAVIEKNEAEEGMKAVASQFKSTIDRAKAEISSSASKINMGFDMRSVECTKEMNYKENTVTIIRLDLEEVVKTRAMPAEERQEELGLQ